MASLSELFGLLNDPVLSQKVSAACLVAAEVVRVEDAGTPNHANRLKWAKKVLNNPDVAGREMLRAVLAANAGFTLAQIQAATDLAIQTAANNAVNIFADGT